MQQPERRRIDTLPCEKATQIAVPEKTAGVERTQIHPKKTRPADSWLGSRNDWDASQQVKMHIASRRHVGRADRIDLRQNILDHVAMYVGEPPL